MNGFQYAVAAWLPIVIFPQTMASTFRYGFPGTFGLVIAALIAIVIIQLLVLREQRRGKAAGPIETDNDSESHVEETLGDAKGLDGTSKPREIKDFA